MRCGKCHILRARSRLAFSHAAPNPVLERPGRQELGPQAGSRLPLPHSSLCIDMVQLSSPNRVWAFANAKTIALDIAMSSNSPIRMIHCHACRVTAPRDEAELARPSGRICLVCGSRLIAEAVAPDLDWTMTEQPGRKRGAIAHGTGDALSG